MDCADTVLTGNAFRWEEGALVGVDRAVIFCDLKLILLWMSGNRPIHQMIQPNVYSK